jgi:methylmalonyl-CoA mutase
MSDLFSSFQATSLADWENVLLKELKGEPIDKLQKISKIEEITFPAYVHQETFTAQVSDPGAPSFLRGTQNETNNWHVATPFRMQNFEVTNGIILNSLMNGTDALVLEATDANTIDFSKVLNDVGLEYIHTTLVAKTVEQVRDFLNYVGNAPAAVVYPDNAALIPLAENAGKCQLFTIQGDLVQRAGGSTWQETSIALAEGHDLLVELMDSGLSVDQAASMIGFRLGIGNKFYFEVSKFRAFRAAWSRIVATYEPEHTHAGAANVQAVTGSLHTSLKDPYTNLLRQTTEALSAVIGGIQSLVIYPFDWMSTEPNEAFSRRMATNISLLLKEESYLDKVIDPAGGSYAIEMVTNEIAERTWAEFQRIERHGGISNAGIRAELTEEIAAKADLRKQAVADKAEKLIGINIFPNPESVSAEWMPLPEAWNGLQTLVLEKVL